MSARTAIYCDGEIRQCPAHGKPWRLDDPLLVGKSHGHVRGALVGRYGWSICLDRNYCPTCATARYGEGFNEPDPRGGRRSA
jgi:hypothetical protein